MTLCTSANSEPGCLAPPAKEKEHVVAQTGLTSPGRKCIYGRRRSCDDKHGMTIETGNIQKREIDLIGSEQSMAEPLEKHFGNLSILPTLSPLSPPSFQDVSERNNTNGTEAKCTLLALPTNQCKPIILCDCGYGWPKQPRPKSERIRAVSRQICNFLQWRNDYDKKKNATRIGSCHVMVASHKEEDIEPLRERMVQSVADDEELKATVEHQAEFCRISITEFIQATGSSAKDHVESSVYLSPDAQDVLDPLAPPPSVVIVGMIVDRRVSIGRSNNRAIKVSCKSARLPLHLLKLEGLEDTEPLNIDTVLEIMQRWWYNFYNNREDENNEDPSAASPELQRARNKGHFVDAAVRAMLHHQERHPNRTLHKTMTEADSTEISER